MIPGMFGTPLASIQSFGIAWVYHEIVLAQGSGLTTSLPLGSIPIDFERRPRPELRPKRPGVELKNEDALTRNAAGWNDREGPCAPAPQGTLSQRMHRHLPLPRVEATILTGTTNRMTTTRPHHGAGAVQTGDSEHGEPGAARGRVKPPWTGAGSIWTQR